MSDLLVRLFGWRAALFHGNTKVYDRWAFLRRRLPKARGTGERVLEVGCGTGAFTMGIARRGYEAVGLSWDERNQSVAERRAAISGIRGISFPIVDVRRLDTRAEFAGAFDAIVCCEVIEHIADDRKLFIDMARCLKPGGRLLLTTPNLEYRSSWNDAGPWSTIEDGGHMRRGYTEPMIRELCAAAGLRIEEITTVSHLVSQAVSKTYKRLSVIIGNWPAWGVVLPLRVLPPLLDGWLGRLLGRAFGWPGYSMALSAYKPRFAAVVVSAASGEAPMGLAA